MTNHSVFNLSQLAHQNGGKKSKNKSSSHPTYQSENSLQVCIVVDHWYTVHCTVCTTNQTTSCPVKNWNHDSKNLLRCWLAPKLHSQWYACPWNHIFHRWSMGVLKWICKCSKLSIIVHRRPLCFCGTRVASSKTRSLVHGFPTVVSLICSFFLRDHNSNVESTNCSGLHCFAWNQ